MEQRTNVPKNLIITRELLNNHPLTEKLSPSEFISTYWHHYKHDYPSNNSTNGNILENLVILALAREGIDNIYYQTELAFVPTAKFDVFLYNERNSVALSIKTTLRERWKQADLEASALKQVHKEALCYVLTLSSTEVRARRNANQTYAGLDGFVLLDTKEFDQLIATLKTMSFNRAGDVPIINSVEKYHTDESLLVDFHFSNTLDTSELE